MVEPAQVPAYATFRESGPRPLRHPPAITNNSGRGIGSPIGPAKDKAPRRVGRPLASESHLAIERNKPWELLKMSRSTWYRRQKEERR